MFNSAPKKVAWLLAAFLAASALLIFWQTDWFRFNASTDSNRLADYGTFISGIVSAVTLVLVVYAYKATQRQIELTQQQIAANEHQELLIQRQSFESTFFNYLESHRAIHSRLQKGSYKQVLEALQQSLQMMNAAIEDLEKRTNMNVGKLKAEYNAGETFYTSAVKSEKEIIDVIYNILLNYYYYAKYSYERETNAQDRVQLFFVFTGFIFENYLQNMFSILRYVDSNELLEEKQKHFYAEILRNNTTVNEKRLIFYYLIFQKDEKARDLKMLLNKYDILASIIEPSGIIQPFDKDIDKATFESI